MEKSFWNFPGKGSGKTLKTSKNIKYKTAVSNTIYIIIECAPGLAVVKVILQ